MPSRSGTAETLSSPAVTFADRNLPKRVHLLLKGVFDLLRSELESGLFKTVAEYEKQLYLQAESARSEGVQAHFLDALSQLRRHGGELGPAFFRELQTALATVRDPVAAAAALEQGPRHGELSLVEDLEIEEHMMVREIGGRAEIRYSLPLYLLGQRFGVMAGRPGFDGESLPIGPSALCRMLGRAIAPTGFSADHRLLFFKQFDRCVVQTGGSFYESVNRWLIDQGVLPNLSFVPYRARPTAQSVPRAAVPAPVVEAPTAIPGLETVEAHTAPAPMVAPEPSPEPVAQTSAQTRWPGMPETASLTAAARDDEMFDMLRQLLAGRRSLVGKFGGRANPAARAGLVAPRADVQTILERLQHLQTAPVLRNGQPVARQVSNLKHDLLMQLRIGQPQGEAVTLAEDDSDTIELVGLLLDQIAKQLPAGSPATALLTRLQVPLLRVALDDKGFFTRAQHPARQMLGAVAETADWFITDDAADRDMLERMRMLVDRVVHDYAGDPAVFEALLADLSQHLRLQIRRAEVAERRHVDAARGKEKLELARLQAAERIDQMLQGRRVPRFLAGLLQQSWSDVLSLALLRHGADSDSYCHQVDIAERLIEAASQRGSGGGLAEVERGALREEIEQGLLQVGYHVDDALVVANRLLAAASQDDSDDPASRTELAMKLKQRTRFGQGVEVHGADDTEPLDEQQAAALEQIKHLPFGAWFEVVDEHGAVSKRRLSWFSPATGHALFVNHRGQRIGEYSLNFLAREMEAGRWRVLLEREGSLVDRAWQAILGALRSFAGSSPEAGS